MSCGPPIWSLILESAPRGTVTAKIEGEVSMMRRLGVWLSLLVNVR